MVCSTQMACWETVTVESDGVNAEKPAKCFYKFTDGVCVRAVIAPENGCECTDSVIGAHA